MDYQQPRPPSSGLGAVNPVGNPELSRWILDPAEIISNLDIWLKGAKIMRDDKGRPVVVESPDGLKILNEKGRQFVLSYLYAHLQRNIVLSDLDERMISEIAYDAHLHVLKELATKWRVYGISSPYQIPIIADQVTRNIFASLSRAKRGEAWKGFRQISVVTENITKNSPPDKQGVFIQ